MSKVISQEELADLFEDKATIMMGGFMGVGAPATLVRILVEQGVKDLTLITSDTATPDTGVGPLIVNRQAKKIIASHIGTNPETGRQMIAGETVVELVPQGTLAERIRAGGAGLGGILTPTGLGTVVEEGKEKLLVNGKEYLLELPLRADIALLKAYKADKAGNLIYRQSARNFNPIMALAADLVIVEVEEVVEVGELKPDEVMTPGILVDKVVCCGRIS
ncbi:MULTISPECIES: acetate CoA-transferase subunit alpha [Pelosinus]|uniref:3-oxoacid CoA-transferase, A subunit n=1 Tax=Pelosinus fermentans B4 TaxID=1149862 RepID=I9AS88_9FIRM|nr:MULTISPECIES: acetate CoA-transferase subunit alpha [Pelosinus]EIW15797.1 3-oxoacid CoA-transferase, A subunit [Pelosinus fermentans B4]EIW27497.1 3-oxoacid CoA-transferase, A subunit [Pelosinus fermentans A11]OAM92545.1 3-oxoacid CoA-transferase, A subunit [Pelosinus fermentans DSM 17108]SDQ48399.1 acetate CoA/acetoacetate CoA-transferase alpha subunit [Pelosinus fermentans]